MGDGARENSEYNTPTGGQAKYIRTFRDTVNSEGINIDLSEIQYEVLYGSASYIKILNTGENTIYVAFDSDFIHIDTLNNLSYNLRISNLEPYNEIEINGEVSKISLKTAAGDTTFEILTW